MADYVSAQVSLTKMDFPVGTILMYPWTTSLPKGWLLCDGSGFATATYPALHSAIGTTYGSTGGFQVPNMTGRVPYGSGTESLGATGGATSVTLSEFQTGLVDHYHRNSDLHTASLGGVASGSNVTGLYGDVDYGTVSTEAAGSAASAHTNVQPYMSMYFIIKAVA
jgi:microcystin-dependent protein